MSDFEDVLNYFCFLMVASLLQAKLNLTIYTFNKALRRESDILRGNIQCLLLILIVTSIFVFINVDVSVLALVLAIALAFRVYWADVELKKKLRK